MSHVGKSDSSKLFSGIQKEFFNHTGFPAPQALVNFNIVNVRVLV